MIGCYGAVEASQTIRLDLDNELQGLYSFRRGILHTNDCWIVDVRWFTRAEGTQSPRPQGGASVS
jgi:hypothetical protein